MSDDVQGASPWQLTLYPGRTTFVNTLCGKKVLQGKDADDATNAHIEEGVRIKPITVGAHANLLDVRRDTYADILQNWNWMKKEPASPSPSSIHPASETRLIMRQGRKMLRSIRPEQR
jgi:hypothetical protein